MKFKPILRFLPGDLLLIVNLYGYSEFLSTDFANYFYFLSNWKFFRGLKSTLTSTYNHEKNSHCLPVRPVLLVNQLACLVEEKLASRLFVQLKVNINI